MISHLQEALAGFPSEVLDRIPLLAKHWELVKSWNSRMSLTGIDDDSVAAWSHYRDCLELTRVPLGASTVDVGSGGGFPGVPIAITMPNTEVTLLEPRRKRVSFLRTTRAQLGLENLQVLHGRSTDPCPQPFDSVVTRATFSNRDDLLQCLDWLAPGGLLVAMRSERGHPEAPEVRGYKVKGTARVLEIWRKS